MSVSNRLVSEGRRRPADDRARHTRPRSPTDQLVVFGKMPIWFYAGLFVALGGALMLLGSLTNLVFTGIGIWATTSRSAGLRHHQLRLVDRHRPRRHADLAILLLLRQEWRTSINRFAEAMTLFAVACAVSTRSSTPASLAGGLLAAAYRTRWALAELPLALIWDVFASRPTARCRCSSGTSA